MKRLTFSFLLALIGFTSLISQNIKRDTGILNGAAYEILMPNNWNKKLVMYAHGYEQTAQSAGKLYPNDMLKVFLDRGFAVARSSYNRTGWAQQEGVDATEETRQFFLKKYGKPDSTFMTGHSMGGGITVSTIEKFPKNYSGGLALCPLANNPYVQTKAAFDNLLVFNVLFPDVYPKVSDVMSGKAEPLFTDETGMKKKGREIAMKLNLKPELIAAYAKRVDMKMKDVPFSIIFADGVLRDLYAQTGGNPFDNTNTLYTGFPDDWEVNKKIERISANVPATRLTTYDRTGIVDKPLLMMHTSYDQIIDPALATNNYDNLVHLTHHEKNLKLFLTNGQGHCNFSDEQIGIAFDALRAWSKSGQKPTEMEIASPPQPKIPDTLCYEMRIYTAAKGKLNDLEKRFRNYTCNFFETCGMTNVGYWKPIDNPDEKLYYIMSYPNRAAREASWKMFSQDTARQSFFKKSEANGKLVEKVESIFLKSTDFSPNNFEPTNGKVWELRIYTATPNNLENLLSRFRDHTVNLFEKYGMTNKVYFTATDAAQGSDKMLYYFLAHKSEAAGKESFKNFGGSNEWKAIRAASEVKGGGSLTSKIESIYMYPTDFSPIK